MNLNYMEGGGLGSSPGEILVEYVQNCDIGRNFDIGRKTAAYRKVPFLDVLVLECHEWY